MPSMRITSRAFRRPGAPGFTLIELMVTIAIAAILLALAAPSFVTFQRNSQLISTVNSFVAALGAARAEAMKQQFNVIVLPVTGTNWTLGWKVCVDSGWTGTCSGSTVLTQDPIPSVVTVSSDGTGGSVVFNGAGFVQNTGAPIYLVFTNGTDIRNVLVTPSGRTQACKPDPSTCTTTATGNW